MNLRFAMQALACAMWLLAGPAVAGFSVTVHVMTPTSSGEVRFDEIQITDRASAEEYLRAYDGSPMAALVRRMFPAPGEDSSFRERLVQINSVTGNDVRIHLVNDTAGTDAERAALRRAVGSELTREPPQVWPHAVSGGPPQLWIGQRYLSRPEGDPASVIFHEFAHTQDRSAGNCCSYGRDRRHLIQEVLGNRASAWSEGLANYFSARESHGFRATLEQATQTLLRERGRGSYDSIGSATFEDFARNEAFNALVLLRLAETPGSGGDSAILATFRALRERGSTSLASFLQEYLRTHPDQIETLINILNTSSYGTATESDITGLLGRHEEIRARMAGTGRVPSVVVVATGANAVSSVANRYVTRFRLTAARASRRRATLDPAGPVEFQYTHESAALARLIPGIMAQRGNEQILMALRAASPTAITTPVGGAVVGAAYQLRIEPSGAAGREQSVRVGILPMGTPVPAASPVAETPPTDIAASPEPGEPAASASAEPEPAASASPAGGGGGGLVTGTSDSANPLEQDVGAVPEGGTDTGGDTAAGTGEEPAASPGATASPAAAGSGPEASPGAEPPADAASPSPWEKGKGGSKGGGKGASK